MIEDILQLPPQFESPSVYTEKTGKSLPPIPLGNQQLEAIEDFHNWYSTFNPAKPDSMVYKLAGLAGTGKTTLVPFMQFRCDDYNWCFGTLSGKASGVLRSKGIYSSTIHSQLYTYTEDEQKAVDGLLLHIKALESLHDDTDDREIKFITGISIKDKQEQLEDIYARKGNRKAWYVLNPDSSFFSPNVICIDEASMIDKVMEVDIMLARKRILYIGDNGQLPPVSKFSSVLFDRYGAELPVNFQLTEPHRQAKENPIIQLSMNIRNGIYPRLGRYGDSVLVVMQDRISDALLNKAEICICGSNKFRQEINSAVRNSRNFESPFPYAGEEIIFKVNNHGKGIFNGMTAKVLSDAIRVDRGTLLLNIEREDGIIMMGEQFSLDFMTGAMTKEQIPSGMFRSRLFADFAYGLTCHSSQGSTYQNGILFGVDCVARSDRDRRRWWYTGVTRFAQKAIIGM